MAVRRTTKRVLLVLGGIGVLGLAACGSETPSTSVSPTATAAATGASSGSSTTAAPTVGEPAATDPLSYTTVDVRAAYDSLTSGQGAQIVDVREPDEWTATGVPPGAVLIPLGQIETRAPAELSADTAVYVICNSGNRSRTASEILISLGFGNVFNVDGGIQAWLAAGLPVESYSD